MTPEQHWQGLVIHAKRVNNVVSRVAKGVMWADDRIKTLEEELKKQKTKHPEKIYNLL